MAIRARMGMGNGLFPMRVPRKIYERGSGFTAQPTATPSVNEVEEVLLFGGEFEVAVCEAPSDEVKIAQTQKRENARLRAKRTRFSRKCEGIRKELERIVNELIELDKSSPAFELEQVNKYEETLRELESRFRELCPLPREQKLEKELQSLPDQCETRSQIQDLTSGNQAGTSSTTSRNQPNI